jgi:type IV secretory pathway VirB10-like protein
VAPATIAPVEVVEKTGGEQVPPATTADNQVAAMVLEPETWSAQEPEPWTEAPAEPEFEDLVISADSVVGLEIETSISSDQAEIEDEVIARVTRDVRVAGRVAIPAGSRAHGEVTLVERGGRLKERARLGVRFTSVVLTDGNRVRLDTETIYREGDPPSREGAAKIGGGAIGGAIIGSIFGGAKGAAIGGSLGAGAGTAAVLAGGRNAATLLSGTPVTVRLIGPATVTVDRR